MGGAGRGARPASSRCRRMVRTRPAVSTSSTGRPSHSNVAATESRVRPGSGPVSQRPRPSRRLPSVDLPCVHAPALNQAWTPPCQAMQAPESARTTLGRPTMAIFSVPGPGSAAPGSAAAAPLLSGPGCGWRAPAALSTSGCSAPYRSTKPSPAGRAQPVRPGPQVQRCALNLSWAHLSQLRWLRGRPAPGALPPPQSRLRHHQRGLRTGQAHIEVHAEPGAPGASLRPRPSALLATSSTRCGLWARSQATTPWSLGSTPARASSTSSTAWLRCRTLAVRLAVRAWMLLSWDCGSSPGSPALGRTRSARGMLQGLVRARASDWRAAHRRCQWQQRTGRPGARRPRGSRA